MRKRYLPDRNTLIWAACGLFVGITCGVFAMSWAVDPVMLKQPILMKSNKGCVLMWIENSDPVTVGYRQAKCGGEGHAD